MSKKKSSKKSESTNSYVKITLPASRASIARRYADGEPLAPIAADYGICKDSVRRIAGEEGVKLRTVGRPAKADK